MEGVFIFEYSESTNNIKKYSGSVNSYEGTLWLEQSFSDLGDCRIICAYRHSAGIGSRYCSSHQSGCTTVYATGALHLANGIWGVIDMKGMRIIVTMSLVILLCLACYPVTANESVIVNGLVESDNITGGIIGRHVELPINTPEPQSEITPITPQITQNGNPADISENSTDASATVTYTVSSLSPDPYFPTPDVTTIETKYTSTGLIYSYVVSKYVTNGGGAGNVFYTLSGKGFSNKSKVFWMESGESVIVLAQLCNGLWSFIPSMQFDAKVRAYQAGDTDVGSFEIEPEGFRGTPTSGYAPLTVTFNDTSTGSPTSWSWDFGDGVTSTLQNPTHTYTSVGSYTVIHTASNSMTIDHFKRMDYITVSPVVAPVANFVGIPLSGTAPLTVTFTDRSTNTPTSWIWSFGDGSTSTSQDPSHTYTSAGTYTVSLTATNAAGSNTKTVANYIMISSASETYVFVTKWGADGLSMPEDVAVDSSGNVYVADTWNNRIQKFTSTGTFITKWGSSGSGDGQFSSPTGVAVDSEGNVYVVDYWNHRIQKFSSTGTFITKWGTDGSGNGQFNNPQDVAVDSSGNVYVADTWNNRIQKFTSTGTFITKWGSSGSGDGQFSFPVGVAVDSSDNVYVADEYNYRIQKFSTDGTFIAKWGSSGSGDGQFSSPNGVAIDSEGNVYVADSGHDRIQKFTSTGTFITKWGSSGSGDGQFSSPNGVAVDSEGNVYVADNDQIQKFALAPSSVIPPVAAFTGSPTSGTASLTVAFTDTSTGSPTSWLWNFGDSSSVNATVKSPVHTYASTGTYTVALTATNSAGSNTLTRTNYITVNAVSGVDNVGVFRDGVFYRNGADAIVYGLSTDTPVVGDWNGDGISEVGVYRGGVFYRNGATTITYGLSTDKPVIGDWNGDGISEVGVYRGGVFYRNGATTITYGLSTDTPVIGDWNGDGISEVGVYRGGVFYRNGADAVVYGLSTDKPVIGDWNGDGISEVGVYRGGVFYRNGATTIAYGLPTDTPVVGKWT